MSKALNIAHNAQQKLSALEKQCSNFDCVKQDLENKLLVIQGKLDAEIEKSKQLTEIIAQKEMELNEVRKQSFVVDFFIYLLQEQSCPDIGAERSSAK